MDTVETALKEFGLENKTIGVNGTTSAVSVLDIKNRINVNFVNGRPILEELRIIKAMMNWKTCARRRPLQTGF